MVSVKRSKGLIASIIIFFVLSLLSLLLGIFFINVRDVLGIIFWFVLSIIFFVAALNFLKSNFYYDENSFTVTDLSGTITVEYKDMVSFNIKNGTPMATRSNRSYFLITKTDGTKIQPSFTCNPGSKDFNDFIEAIKKSNPSVKISIPIYRKNIFGEY